jgi:Tfp pilus assembly protein PilO
MSTTETGERRASSLDALLDHLHDPLKLRIFVVATVLAAGYAGVYMPLSDRIETLTRKLNQDRKSLELAVTIEQLQQQYHLFEERLPVDADTKDWIQYVLAGIRQFPVRLTKLDANEPKAVGPYKAIVLQIQLEGTFADADKVLRWLESNPRLFRTDSVTLAPGTTEGAASMTLTVLGLTG